MGVPAFYRWCVAIGGHILRRIARPAVIRSAHYVSPPLLYTRALPRHLCPSILFARLCQKYGKCIEDCVEDPPGTDIEGPNPNGVEFDA